MPVKTIVLVMMENRSFDHLLGWMSLPPYGNRTDIDGLVGGIDPATNELTNPPYVNHARNQAWRPFIATQDFILANDLPHGRDLVRVQMHPDEDAKFLMDGFADAYIQQCGLANGTRPEAMMMYPPNLVPATSFLARAFMVCNNWFSPIPTDTHPNRIMSLAGFTKIDHTQGRPPNHDIVLDWCDNHDPHIRWRVYSDGFSFITALRPLNYLTSNKQFKNCDELAADFQTEPDDTFPQLIIVEPEYSDDPTVSNPNDNHPPNPIGPGEAFLADTYRAVTSNPERWANTVMIVVYDEHGGYFDHVPPIRVTTPPPADHEWADPTPFTTSGPRVPAIIVSPLVKRASFSSLRFDHTSILQFVADVFDNGNAYSDLVTARHKEGQIASVSAVIADSIQQGLPPAMPPMGPFNAVAYSANRTPTTPGMEAFANARAAIVAKDPAALANLHPASLLHTPVKKA
jgi:phospholipase C